MYEKITEYKINNATLTEKKMKSLMCGKCFDVEPWNPLTPLPPTRQQFWERKYKLACEMSQQNSTYTPPHSNRASVSPEHWRNCVGKRPSLRLGPSSCKFLKLPWSYTNLMDKIHRWRICNLDPWDWKLQKFLSYINNFHPKIKFA